MCRFKLNHDPLEEWRMTSVTLERDLSTRIVDVAELLFGELGFRKTTVSDIARELKMSPANIYRFFDSKADINLARLIHLSDGHL
jgi:AcrR family transcriptional regulator